MDVSIIIPAYNEEEGITEVVRSLVSVMAASGHNYEIVVVDDGSGDATAEKARVAGAKVIEQLINRGYGQAILTGMENAKYDLIATIDADSSYCAEDLARILPWAQKFAMVIGQRTGKAYRGRFLKYPARILFRFFAEYISGVAIPDINSGLRIFRRSAYKLFPKSHECTGFSFSTTTTLLFLAAGYSARFIPVEYRHRSGSSKINYFRDTLRALQILLEIGIHFNPLKIILPMCIVPLLLAGIFAGAYVSTESGLWFTSALISFYMSAVIFGIGMILLQIKVSGD